MTVHLKKPMNVKKDATKKNKKKTGKGSRMIRAHKSDDNYDDDDDNNNDDDDDAIQRSC